MDDKIREALEGLNVPFNASHWQNFEEKLDATDLTTDDSVGEEAFDASLAANLANINTGTADWDNFVEKLDAAESQDPFDAIIAAGLTAATASAGADWGSFEEMLSAAEAEDLTTDNNIFDQKVQQNLEDYEAPYEPENWTLMRERIQEEFSLRRKLIRYRVVEVSVMMLAIFTLFNYLPKNELGNFIILEQVKERIKQKVSPQKTQEAALQNAPIASVISKINKTETESKIDLDIFSPEIKTNYVATGDAISIYAGQKVKTFSPLAVLETPLEVNAANVKLKASNISVSEEKEKKKGLFAWMKKDEESKSEIEKDETIKSFLLEALESKKAAELSSNEEENLQASKVKLEHKNVRLAMFTSADLYGVYAPYDRFFNYSPGTAYDANMGGGILLDFQKNRFHIVTGGAYMPKYYQPSHGDEVIGSFETEYIREDLEEIKLDIVHIPLDLRYDFVQRPKWRLYGVAGAAFNIVLETAYDIEQEVIASNTILSRTVVSNDRDFDSNLDKKEFHEGLIEGGGLPENVFLTAQLGFGVERFVTQRWSIFFEPVYQQQFSGMGIGPNENSFRTVSLRLGAKATMFGK